MTMAGAANGSQCHCHSATLHHQPNHWSCLIFMSYCSLVASLPPALSHLSLHIICSSLLPLHIGIPTFFSPLATITFLLYLLSSLDLEVSLSPYIDFGVKNGNQLTALIAF